MKRSSDLFPRFFIPQQLSPLQYALLTILLAVLYYLSARLSLLLAFHQTNATPVWPPSGIALAFVWIFGYRLWPGVTIGAFFANLAVFHANQFAGPFSIVLMSFVIALGNTAEILLGRFLLTKFQVSPVSFYKVENIMKFLSLTMIACLSSSLIGVTVLGVLGKMPPELLQMAWLTWWLGDVGGILTVTPFVLAFYQSDQIRWDAKRTIEFLFLLVLLVAVGRGIFYTTTLIPHLSFMCTYFLLPLVVWSAYRFGPSVTSLTVLIILGFAIGGTLQNTGPFTNVDLNHSLLFLLVFISVLSTTGMILAAAIKQRREAEQELAAHNAELKRSNEDLEQFAYVASHDLREPLSVTSNFADLLLKRYKGKLLDEKAEEFLGHMIQGLKQMHTLIDSLLEYSRVRKNQPSLEKVDCRQCAQQAVDNIQLLVDQAQAEINIGELPVILGDRTQLVQLFQNLITNSVKFRSERPCKVRISCRKEKKQWVVLVEDNGIGIKAEHFDKIFGVFQRLHNYTAYPGIGLGLAICKKIVQYHGGEIYVESEYGKGSKFYFTLAAA